MSGNTREHVSLLEASGTAPCSAEAALRSFESQLKVIFPSESSLWEEVRQLQSEKTRLEWLYELGAWRGVYTSDSLDNASEMSGSLRETIQEGETHYYQYITDLWYVQTFYRSHCPL